MKGDRRSMAKEVVPWWEEEAAAVVREDEARWKCRKHTAQPRYGICPFCLRERLLRLCPDCAKVRPCGCFPSSSSSSSSACFSPLSTAELARSGGCGGGGGGACGGAGIGAVGPVSRLIESEPAFRRSRSVGFQLLRSAASTGEVAPPRGVGKGWAAPGKKESTTEAKLCKSRSVAAGRTLDAVGGREGGRWKGRRWHFPNPMKVLRQGKSKTKVEQGRSPLRAAS